MLTSIPSPSTSNVAARVAANVGFVVGLAQEFRGRGVPLEDLVSEGHVGLIEAARRFDDERGAKFTTYAGWWIRKRILKALAEQPRSVRMSCYGRRRERERGAVPSSARPRIVGLEDRSAEETKSIGEVLAAPGAGAEESLLRDEAVRIVRERLAELPPVERRVLSLRFALDGGEGITLKEVGMLLGVSRERVRQIEARAMDRLRRAVLSRHAPRTRGAA